MRTQRVTPEQFSILCVALLDLEARGYDPETCTRQAYKRAGIPAPTPFENVEIVVDRETQS